jgi:hypothetical protein
MTTFRDDFISHFGEENALAIEAAADSHKNGVHDKEGSDRLRWALLICIGYDCIEKYSADHQITCSWEDVRDWMKMHKEYIGKHDGDSDYLAMLCGRYNEFVL